MGIYGPVTRSLSPSTSVHDVRSASSWRGGSVVRAVLVIGVAIALGGLAGAVIPSSLENLRRWSLRAGATPTEVGWNTVLSRMDGDVLTQSPKDLKNPFARALAEQRARLLQSSEPSVREATANLMAGLARQAQAYKNDPVVLLALRSGAVRLVLNDDDATRTAVGRLMGQVATRMERHGPPPVSSPSVVRLSPRGPTVKGP